MQTTPLCRSVSISVLDTSPHGHCAAVTVGPCEHIPAYQVVEDVVANMQRSIKTECSAADEVGADKEPGESAVINIICNHRGACEEIKFLLFIRTLSF